MKLTKDQRAQAAQQMLADARKTASTAAERVADEAALNKRAVELMQADRAAKMPLKGFAEYVGAARAEGSATTKKTTIKKETAAELAAE